MRPGPGRARRLPVRPRRDRTDRTRACPGDRLRQPRGPELSRCGRRARRLPAIPLRPLTGPSDLGPSGPVSWSTEDLACRRGDAHQTGDPQMNETSSVQAVMAVFAAVERRDDAAFARSCQPDAEFCWPPSLPYGRTVRGLTD